RLAHAVVVQAGHAVGHQLAALVEAPLDANLAGGGVVLGRVDGLGQHLRDVEEKGPR
nr:hypothetical protein [Tanacetum cinerariifolium]